GGLVSLRGGKQKQRPEEKDNNRTLAPLTTFKKDRVRENQSFFSSLLGRLDVSELLDPACFRWTVDGQDCQV
ncbi:MAG TPA: hypothetical protein VHQ22_20125, partial [Terriglobales bacterium]|nr:hypothetical protein [Terriglobales bacterium]